MKSERKDCIDDRAGDNKNSGKYNITFERYCMVGCCSK